MDPSPLFAALADPTRRRLFEAIAARPQSVGELAEQMPVSRPAVSQHLKVLQAARLVRFQKFGTKSVYELDAAGLQTLRGYLDTFWDGALASLRQVAEASFQASQASSSRSPAPRHSPRKRRP
jgi:DNA-binding transcriptional ArsR family regulator